MARKIVIFADGTGNTVGGVDSNVLRLCKMLDSSEEAGQLAIYDPGVGTMASLESLHAALSPRVRVIDDDARRPTLVRFSERGFGSLFGYGTHRNIRRLYRKLICVYEPGDEIFLFGFSRGAFTVRALAGVVYICGVPRPECVDQADNAVCLSKMHFEACRSSEELRFLKEAAQDFKRKYARACSIRFLGVWDTVKSVGYMFPRNLPHTRHNPIAQTVRHALSLGEHRSSTPLPRGAALTRTLARRFTCQWPAPGMSHRRSSGRMFRRYGSPVTTPTSEEAIEKQHWPTCHCTG